MSTENSEPGFSRGREYLILLVLAAVQLCSIVDFMVVMPLEPQLRRDLGMTPFRFGLMVSSYTYAAGIAGVLASLILDRYPRRTAFLGLFAGFLSGTLACGLAPTYEWLLAARILTGAFGGILGGMSLTIIGDVFHEKRRGTATGALMSAFALASVIGVPVGLMLGQNYGWHTPFLVLAALAVPAFILAATVLPRLDAHLLTPRPHVHPLARLKATFTEPNHLRAFGLTISLMFGAFCVVPYLSPFLVSNAKIEEDKLAVVYIVGGLLTLVGAPIAGKLADRFGKLRMYRIIAPMLAVMLIVATNLPEVSLPIAAAVMGILMLCNAGRMVSAMAMVTSSVAPQQRAGFLGANSAVQHVAAGIGSSVGGFILLREGFLGYDATYHEMSAGIGGSVGGFVLSSAYDGIMVNYPIVGLVGVAATLISLWLAGRLRTVGADHPTTAVEALAAAAQGNVDADEPITLAEL